MAVMLPVVFGVDNLGEAGDVDCDCDWKQFLCCRCCQRYAPPKPAIARLEILIICLAV